VPYAIDTVKGRAKPARSARLMFVFLLLITLLQQRAVQSGWLMAVTIGELIGSIGILALALKHGEGGLSRLDKACYALMAFDVVIWLSTGNALLALHLSVLADLIAFTPTLVKTWHRPHTETPTFFVIGLVAPALNVAAASSFSYAVLLFPVYLVVVNLVELILIVVRGKLKTGGKPQPTEPVI
jgi:hypothetical protein